MRKIIILEKQAGKRLDKFLAEENLKLSRNQIQKLIKNKAITINKNLVSSHYKIKKGDIILIDFNNSEEKKIKEKINQKIIKPIIIKKTDEYYIINKPANLITHSAPQIKQKTLSDILMEDFLELKKVGDDPYRPGIVHRLDKEASGLMVIPRTQDSFDNIKKQFQNRTIQKTYTALVYGKIDRLYDDINFPIKRSTQNGKMVALPETVKKEKNKQGRQAISQFTVIKNFINFTLLEVKIKTGRTHQIRVHLSAYGHPIVGDNLYSTKKTREKNKKINLNRIFLVANKIKFKNLKEEEKEYNIKLPNELLEILKNCR